MNIQMFVIIGGVVIGFLILIFGILALKKMKNEEDNNDKKNEDGVKQGAASVEAVSIDNNSLEAEKAVSVESPFESEVDGLEPEANASDLFKEEVKPALENSDNKESISNDEEDSVSAVLNDDVKLNNSSLDSEIVSKPSVETEEDFLQKTPEDSISPVKVDNLPNDSTDTDKVEKLF